MPLLIQGRKLKRGAPMRGQISEPHLHLHKLKSNFPSAHTSRIRPVLDVLAVIVGERQQDRLLGYVPTLMRRPFRDIFSALFLKMWSAVSLITIHVQ